MTTSRRQSIAAPIFTNCSRIWAMFFSVHAAGCRWRSIAAFSALMPNASKPIGNSTLWPFIRMNRAAQSAGAYAYQWPTCTSPEGYGNAVRK